MPEIKSPLGTRTYPVAQKQVFSVPDESASMFEIPDNVTTNLPQNAVQLTPEQFNEFQTKKQALRISSQKTSSEARQRVELLTGIGRLETSVEVGGHKFTLQSLKAREMREVVKCAAKIEAVADQIFELRLQTLARSIIQIDHQPFDLILGASNIETKLVFIDECEDHIINYLYAAYSEMIKQNENKLNIKSAEEAQEVVNEIKK